MKFEIRSGVLPLIVINIIVFILQILLGRGFTDFFLLASEDIFTRPWILLTHMFLHGSAMHLLYNMYGLFIFGSVLEERIGAKRFILFYLFAGIMAGFLSSFFYVRSLGASGALMGVIGVLIILMPNLTLLFFYILPTPLWLAGLIYVAIDIIGIFFPSGVGNIAHLAGMGLGLLYGFYMKKEKKVFTKKFSSKKHLEEADIDEYLRSGRI